MLRIWRQRSPGQNPTSPLTCCRPLGCDFTGSQFPYLLSGDCCCLVAQSCLTLCDPMDCRKPGFPVHHQLPDLAQTHVHRVSDAIQLSHPLSYPSPPALNLSPSPLPRPIRVFSMNQFFVSGRQSIGVSVLASVLPMNIRTDFLQD